MVISKLDRKVDPSSGWRDVVLLQAVYRGQGICSHSNSDGG
jgi:hypothetical protein